MSIKIPKKFSRGGVLSADRLNEIIDCCSELAKNCDLDEVKAGAGLKETPYGNGGKVISLANFSKGAASISGSSSSSGGGGALYFPFKASISDGLLTIAKGYVLVKPHSISYGGENGSGVKFSQSELVAKQTISVPVNTYSFEATVPESELQYVREVNAGRNGTVKTAFNVAIPKYEASSTTESLSLTVTTGVSYVTEIHQFLTSVHMMDAILNTGEVTTEVLVHVGEIDDCLERVSIPVGNAGTTTETVQIKSLAGVTLTQAGTETVEVEVEVPVYEIATELATAPWITGGTLKKGETEMAEVEAEVGSKVINPESTDFNGSSSESVSGSEKDGVYFLEVPEYSTAAMAGLVVMLKISLEDGDGASFEWQTSTMDEIAAKGYWSGKETRQAADVTVKGEFTSESENSVFGVSVSISGSEFFSSQGIFPIAAALNDGNGEYAYQLHFGVLNYTPPVELSFNYAGRSTEGLSTLKDLTAHNDLSEGAIFPIENNEILEAMNAEAKEGSE